MQAYWRPDSRIRRPLETTCVVRTRNGELLRVPLRHQTTIGRQRDSSICLFDDMVSRRHAWFVETVDGFAIVDGNGDNRTWVGGRMLEAGEPTALTVGMSILVGRASISFVHQLPGHPLPADEQRLLDAICESPEDDEPRLVLADLLTSRGDPRGEFISLQIAAESSVNRDAVACAEALLATHEYAWLAPLPVPVASWTWRRGFLDCVWVLPDTDVSPLRAVHPLRTATHTV